tara:strand:- start:515 stop:1642 length:1128 start_codon:yes stop_codon:yes gene_type:complete
MHSDVIIEKVTLTNFRSHKNTNLKTPESNVVLFGENGSGKTNILEAISLFSPGRGLRGAVNQDLIATDKIIDSFEIKILLKYKSGSVTLYKKFLNSEKKESYYLADGEKISSNELLNYLRIIWITPVMEKIMLQSNTEKRNFFDRLIFNIEKQHLKNLRQLNRFFKERITLIQNHPSNEGWISIVEEKIACLSFELLETRNKILSLINNELGKIAEPFSSCDIEFIYAYDVANDATNYKDNGKEFISKYKNQLKLNRSMDAEINKTLINVNKVRVIIWKGKERKLESKDCSTGEQKSMLIAIIISVAKLIKEHDLFRAPIILIDEAMAHLDEFHKNQLLLELENINSQAWFTGVSKELFSNINDQTVFFEIKNHI